MTQLLVSDYRESPDCDYVWPGTVPPTRDCAVHACVIQWGHDHPCLCGRCGAATWKPRLNLPTRWSWVGNLDDCAFT